MFQYYNYQDQILPASYCKQDTIFREEPGSSEDDAEAENDSQASSRGSRKSSTEDGEKDEERDDEDAPQRSTRKRRRVRAPRIPDDTVLDEATLDSVRAPTLGTPARERAVRIMRKVIGPARPRTGRKCRRKSSEKKKKKEDRGDEEEKGESEKGESELEEVMEQYKPPLWLTAIRPTRSPYLPQIADMIYYFVQVTTVFPFV